MISQPCVALGKNRGISYYTDAITTTSPLCKCLKKCLKTLPVCFWRLKEVSVQCRGKFRRRRCFNFQEAQEEEKKRKTTRGNMKRNRRRSRNMEKEEEERDWFDLMAMMGMPLLYIIGLLTGIVGAICQGVITEYWANPGSGADGSCYLYGKTASSVKGAFQFGSAIAVCEWVTYGGVVAIIIAFISGLVYIIKVRQNKELTYSSALSVAGILVATLLMLAVTCTIAEGMRMNCASMGINSANNKGESCYEKLDKRAPDNIPVLTSTMVRAALIALVCSTVAFFTICCFQISDFYRRTLRHRYSDVPYQDRG
ncbi:hypothetical protein GWK47_048471 [Chionoecetes opilio]|uniref:Uncharacterized protein n=1 Tax=Chionoecetes opilio TaxID=41210 RepID=A0A8J4Y3V7_CHIOP|nr:hypothetical protein GWK47_048471 [Chionoecetes opilio]